MSILAFFIKPPKQSRDHFTFLLYKISLSTAVITYNLWRSNPSRSSAQETSSQRLSCRERGSCRSELPPRPPPLAHLALTAWRIAICDPTIVSLSHIASWVSLPKLACQSYESNIFSFLASHVREVLK